MNGMLECNDGKEEVVVHFKMTLTGTKLKSS